MQGLYRKYAMFPVRLVFVVMGLATSVAVIALGRPWREEWSEMDLRGYLLQGKNWNAAGF